MCPAHVGLHECRLAKGIWENTSGKTHEEKHDKYNDRVLASSIEVYNKFKDKFKDTDLFKAFASIDLRDDEERMWEVLDDFWSAVRKEWMYVANEEARNILRPLKDSHMILAMAEIHQKIALSNINMTAVASEILSLDNPDIYAISRTIDEIKEYSPDVPENVMMWNFPAARDVLKKLAQCYTPIKWEL